MRRTPDDWKVNHHSNWNGIAINYQNRLNNMQRIERKTEIKFVDTIEATVYKNNGKL